VGFFSPTFQVRLHNSISIIHAYKQISSQLSIFPLQKGLTTRLHTILLQAMMHAQKMNQIGGLRFLSSQLFFHCVINSAKRKDCQSQNTKMWWSGKTYLFPYAKGKTFTTHHSFTLI